MKMSTIFAILLLVALPILTYKAIPSVAGQHAEPNLTEEEIEELLALEEIEQPAMFRPKYPHRDYEWWDLSVRRVPRDFASCPACHKSLGSRGPRKICEDCHLPYQSGPFPAYDPAGLVLNPNYSAPLVYYHVQAFDDPNPEIEYMFEGEPIWLRGQSAEFGGDASSSCFGFNPNTGDGTCHGITSQKPVDGYFAMNASRLTRDSPFQYAVPKGSIPNGAECMYCHQQPDPVIQRAWGGPRQIGVHFNATNNGHCYECHVVSKTRPTSFHVMGPLPRRVNTSEVTPETGQGFGEFGAGLYISVLLLLSVAIGMYALYKKNKFWGKLGGASVLLLLMLTSFAQGVAAVTPSDVRKAAEAYSKPTEAIAVNGPYSVKGKEYYVVEYFSLGSPEATLVYDAAAGSFKVNDDTYNKVLATKDMSTLLLNDPLYYSAGDPSKIPLAAKFEVENVKNFAEFVAITSRDVELLSDFIKHYEEAALDIAYVITLTNKMLYPKEMFSVSYSSSPPAISMDVKDLNVPRAFSYESFQTLSDAYANVNNDYRLLIDDVIRLSGDFEEYPADTPIREKWGIVVTTDSLKRQIELLIRNEEVVNSESDLRKQIIEWSYSDRQTASVVRLEGAGFRQDSRTIAVSFLFLVAIVLGVYYMRKRPPGLFLILLAVAVVGAPVASQAIIPRASDLLAMKVKDASRVPLHLETQGIDEATARSIIAGYPLLLEGEGIHVSGPFYLDGKSHYLFEVTKGDSFTGIGFLVDENQILVGDQKKAFHIIKTRFARDAIGRKSLYANADAEAIAKNAETALPPIDSFLLNLSANIKDGNRLEQELISKPDWATLESLIGNYMRSFVLINNIKQFLTPEDASSITAGFSDQAPWLEAYVRVMKGLTADDYLQGRIAMYRGRTLNRLPLMFQLANMGFTPSKGQLVQDLTSDMLHDNYYFWRLERVTDPALFARLAFKEGTLTFPAGLDESVLNQTD